MHGGDACFHNALRSRSRQSQPYIVEATAVPSEKALGTFSSGHWPVGRVSAAGNPAQGLAKPTHFSLFRRLVWCLVCSRKGILSDSPCLLRTRLPALSLKSRCSTSSAVLPPNWPAAPCNGRPC